jgi:hypothetical protein
MKIKRNCKRKIKWKRKKPLVPVGANNRYKRLKEKSKARKNSENTFGTGCCYEPVLKCTKGALGRFLLPPNDGHSKSRTHISRSRAVAVAQEPRAVAVARILPRLASAPPRRSPRLASAPARPGAPRRRCRPRRRTRTRPRRLPLTRRRPGSKGLSPSSSSRCGSVHTHLSPPFFLSQSTRSSFPADGVKNRDFVNDPLFLLS